MNTAQWQSVIRQRQPIASYGDVLLLPAWCCGRNARYGLEGSVEFDILQRENGRKVGKLALRLGESRPLFYLGHIGYHIDDPYRGHHLAQAACRAATGILLGEGMRTAVITTDPDNVASRKTCLALGCLEEATVSVPLDGQRLWQISARKVRYVWLLA